MAVSVLINLFSITQYHITQKEGSFVLIHILLTGAFWEKVAGSLRVCVCWHWVREVTLHTTGCMLDIRAAPTLAPIRYYTAADLCSAVVKRGHLQRTNFPAGINEV